ncbi:serine/threonine-protein kinase [Streptomyces sp. NPDC050161]|uniref:serine/threonine-protein kinase n=1 Tax=Streptomyces sp. NPDC050161 TaxID=3365604 RepID=UPI0037ABE05E
MQHYEVVKFLGYGGQGEVYAGCDTRDGKTVCIKFQLPRIDESASHYGDLIRGFVQEAARARFLSGTSWIPRVVDSGWYRDRYCIVMEYVDGILLFDAMIGARPLKDRATVASIIGQLCEALREVHEHGMVHRDVKPENVMLQPDGQLRLLDLGMAVAAGEPTMEPCGTPGFRSPEQGEAQATGVTPLSDVFSLGCMLLEMTIMHLPYEAGRERPGPDSPVLPPKELRLIPGEFRPLAMAMVHRDTAYRPSIREVFDTVRPYLPSVGSRPPVKPLTPDPTEYYRHHAPAL